MSNSAGGQGWFEALNGARLIGVLPDKSVAGIEMDSRTVAAGSVFVAVPGASFDGHDFIAVSIERGASAIIVQADRQPKWAEFEGRVPLVVVESSRVALAQAAAGFCGHPARSLGMVGVTGTDGKTTTAHLIAHVLTACGLPAGYLSSVAFGMPDGTAELNATHMTTVEAPEIQRQLARIRDAGGRYAIVEASSIGLDMHRVDECEFDVGVFTNLAPDHLDYHGTMDAYRDAKSELFRTLDRSKDKGLTKAAVLNAEDAASGHMRSATHQRTITYGHASNADVHVRDVEATPNGSRISVGAADEAVEVRLPLLGEFNVMNALAAIGVARSQGVALVSAAEALESFPGVPGRMELIDEGQWFRVVVDIASTEQAMRNVLNVLRPLTAGRLIVVFGAAGERDHERRAGLARAVAAFADHAIVTNEDPRTEDPDAIIDEIARGLAGSGFDSSHVERIADRRSAIVAAFRLARADDTVLLAGKATEPSIVIGTTHHAWDERAVARDLLHERVLAMRGL